MKIVLRLGFYTLAILASVGLAAFSDQYAAFGKGPARFLMTREEISAWKTVRDDVAAKEFVERFWAHRDPEFRVQFDQRVAFADEKLTHKKKRGSLTDMGRVLIIMGPPSQQREHKGSPQMTRPWYERDIDRRGQEIDRRGTNFKPSPWMSPR